MRFCKFFKCFENPLFEDRFQNYFQYFNVFLFATLSIVAEYFL